MARSGITIAAVSERRALQAPPHSPDAVHPVKPGGESCAVGILMPFGLWRRCSGVALHFVGQFVGGEHVAGGQEGGLE